MSRLKKRKSDLIFIDGFVSVYLRHSVWDSLKHQMQTWFKKKNNIFVGITKTKICVGVVKRFMTRPVMYESREMCMCASSRMNDWSTREKVKRFSWGEVGSCRLPISFLSPFPGQHFTTPLTTWLTRDLTAFVGHSRATEQLQAKREVPAVWDHFYGSALPSYLGGKGASYHIKRDIFVIVLCFP